MCHRRRPGWVEKIIENDGKFGESFRSWWLIDAKIVGFTKCYHLPLMIYFSRLSAESMSRWCIYIHWWYSGTLAPRVGSNLTWQFFCISHQSSSLPLSPCHTMDSNGTILHPEVLTKLIEDARKLRSPAAIWAAKPGETSVQGNTKKGAWNLEDSRSDRIPKWRGLICCYQSHLF